MTGDILLVDDEAGIRKVLGISLTDLGYTVHTAENAAAALTIIEAVRPSITLTDWRYVQARCPPLPRARRKPSCPGNRWWP